MKILEEMRKKQRLKLLPNFKSEPFNYVEEQLQKRNIKILLDEKLNKPLDKYSIHKKNLKILKHKSK